MKFEVIFEVIFGWILRAKNHREVVTAATAEFVTCETFWDMSQKKPRHQGEVTRPGELFIFSDFWRFARSSLFWRSCPNRGESRRRPREREEGRKAEENRLESLLERGQ